MVLVTVGEKEYSIERKLVEVWDKLKDGKLAKKDEDRCYVVDGREGTGKSLFTFQQAAYIDPTIIEDGEDGTLLPRICFTPQEFIQALRNTKSTKERTRVVIWDEAFRGMSSKAALSKINKEITQVLMEVRQHNLVIFIVSPSFYLLEFYPAVLRTNTLFHIVKQKNSMLRYARIFNYEKKAKLYQTGVRKAWGYPVKTRNKARFFNKYPGGDDFEERYRKKKSQSFRDDDIEDQKVVKYRTGRNAAIRILKENGFTYDKLIESLEEKGYSISRRQLIRICNDQVVDI